MSVDLNRAVITTRAVLEGRSKIVYISHDSDGDWQFLGKEDGLKEDDARVISLGEVLEMEPAIRNLLWMPQGMQAWWDDEKEDWRTGISENSTND